MTLLGDLFSSEKSTGKKNIYHISADCGEFGPGGAMPADPPHGCRGSGPLHNGSGWRMADTCPEAKINTIIIIITASLFAAPQNKCVTTVFCADYY